MSETGRYFRNFDSYLQKRDDGNYDYIVKGPDGIPRARGIYRSEMNAICNAQYISGDDYYFRNYMTEVRR